MPMSVDGNAELAAHWRLERLEVLFEITADPILSPLERIDAILRFGYESLGLEVGLLARVDGDRFLVVRTAGPDLGVHDGALIPLSLSPARIAVSAGELMAFEDLSPEQREGQSFATNQPLRSYVHCPIRDATGTTGFIGFGARQTRSRSFSADERTLVRHIAQWVAMEWSRQDALETVAEREAALRKATALFESLFRDTPRAMIFANADREIQMVNDAFTRLFGYELEDLFGKTTQVLYAEEVDFKQTGRQRYHRDAEKQLAPYEIRYRRKNGEIFDAETIGGIIRDPAGQTLGYVGHIQDVSERKQVERMKDEFVAMVSHELRTPLTSIHGALGLIVQADRDCLPERSARLLEIAQRNTERLLRIVNDLLDAQRIVAGELELELQSHDVQRLVRQAVEDAQPMLDAHQVRVSVSLSPELTRITTDSGRLLQVLNNLLSNAAKFSPLHGVVHVDVWCSASTTKISVRDEGPGIPDEFRPHIFERFTQADSSAARSRGGTGLGLSITRSLVEAMGGDIYFETEVGAGTTFVVELPLGLETAAAG